MAIRIPTNQVIDLQQIEAVVAGPDGANRLFAVTGRLGGNFGKDDAPFFHKFNPWL